LNVNKRRLIAIIDSGGDLRMILMESTVIKLSLVFYDSNQSLWNIRANWWVGCWDSSVGIEYINIQKVIGRQDC
jgi:hypothetical protein